jgi:hypothetical protein
MAGLACRREWTTRSRLWLSERRGSSSSRLTGSPSSSIFASEWMSVPAVSTCCNGSALDFCVQKLSHHWLQQNNLPMTAWYTGNKIINSAMYSILWICGSQILQLVAWAGVPFRAYLGRIHHLSRLRGSGSCHCWLLKPPVHMSTPGLGKTTCCQNGSLKEISEPLWFNFRRRSHYLWGTDSMGLGGKLLVHRASLLVQLLQESLGQQVRLHPLLQVVRYQPQTSLPSTVRQALLPVSEEKNIAALKIPVSVPFDGHPCKSVSHVMATFLNFRALPGRSMLLWINFCILA